MVVTDVNDGPATFCREVEAYLCRKNDGHLIRIVGPAFEQVCGWATRGIPIRIVFRGIDRYFGRYYAKGPRRRPVRVEFCEADILDVFDDWRRAVGVGAAVGAVIGAGAQGEGGSPDEDSAVARKRGTLPAHLDRVVAKLTALRGGADRSRGVTLDEIVREIDMARAGSTVLRGAARDALIERLRTLDERLLQEARAGCDASTLLRLEAEADVQLAPFRDRMAAEVYARSKRACIDRLIREHLRLPVIAFD
ncbi:MAG: hypothetical protein EXQ53_08900 [Acidobacteria bacterium]|nr:hypothetical protein [Acidobacteriota bacterium]